MRRPTRSVWVLCLMVTLGTVPAGARSACVESGTTTLNFEGRSGLVVTAVRGEVEVLRATFPDNDRRIVWVGRPFPSLSIARPAATDALTLTLTPALPGCILSVELY